MSEIPLGSPERDAQSIFLPHSEIEKAESIDFHRRAALERLAISLNEANDAIISYEHRSFVLAEGAILVDFADGSMNILDKTMLHGVFYGFEVQDIADKPYLVASVVPPEALFMPEDGAELVNSWLILSAEHKHEGYTLILDPRAEVLGDKLREWRNIITDAMHGEEPLFPILKRKLVKIFGELASDIEFAEVAPRLDSEIAAFTEIQLFDIPAIDAMLQPVLNRANQYTMHVTSTGCLVSANSDNRHHEAKALTQYAEEEITHHGVYRGVVAMQSERKKKLNKNDESEDPEMVLASVSPQPYLVLERDEDAELVLIPFWTIINHSFGDIGDSHESLPVSARVKQKDLEKFAAEFDGTDSWD